jgi:hypothetical protein
VIREEMRKWEKMFGFLKRYRAILHMMRRRRSRRRESRTSEREKEEKKKEEEEKGREGLTSTIE